MRPIPDEVTPSEAQFEAMEALFGFAEAVNEGHLTIHDLAAVMRMAIADGHDNMVICLAMAQHALRLSRAAEER